MIQYIINCNQKNYDQIEKIKYYKGLNNRIKLNKITKKLKK